MTSGFLNLKLKVIGGWSKSVPAMYVSHQNEKKTEYGPRAREVAKATLTAPVMSTSGGMGKEFIKIITII